MIGSGVSQGSHAKSSFPQSHLCFQNSERRVLLFKQKVGLISEREKFLSLFSLFDSEFCFRECHCFDALIDELSDERVKTLVLPKNLSAKTSLYVTSWAKIFHPQIQVLVV